MTWARLTADIPAQCGHGTASATVSEGRCWDCHLDNLRRTGDGRRADRLVTLKRQHEEGQFDYDVLCAAMACRLTQEFARRYDDPERLHNRKVSALVNGD